MEENEDIRDAASHEMIAADLDEKSGDKIGAKRHRRTAAWLQELLNSREEIKRQKGWIDDLQSGMYINCVYCGHRYGPDDEVPASMADILKEHVANCPKHPMSQLKKALEPFAKMHRESGNPMEIACIRGTGHEATHICSRDFEAAAKALEGTWDMTGTLEGRLLGIEQFVRDHCDCQDVEAKNPESILYEYVEALERGNAVFQDFACAVSDAVWGGELGWDQDDGLKKLADAVRDIVKEKRLCTVVDSFDGNVVRQARFNALVGELERAKKIIGKHQNVIIEIYCTARHHLKPPTQLALTRQEELEKGLEKVSEICREHGATKPAIALRDWNRLLELLKGLTYDSQQPGSCRLTVKIPYFDACEIMDYRKSIPETSGLQDIERDFERERLVLKFESPEDRKTFEELHELKIDKAT